MDKKVEKPGDLVFVEFAMFKEPKGVQFTKHLNNMLITYGTKKYQVTDDFKYGLETNDLEVVQFRVRQLIQYYGREYLKKWFAQIYSWEFKEVA